MEKRITIMGQQMETCPYCGQVNLSGGDPRMLCGCHAARKYRKILTALDKQSTQALPMLEIDEGVMMVLTDLAHYICALKVDSATLKLSDGTAVTIAGKVSRTKRLKVEEKVDE